MPSIRWLMRASSPRNRRKSSALLREWRRRNSLPGFRACVFVSFSFFFEDPADKAEAIGEFDGEINEPHGVGADGEVASVTMTVSIWFRLQR